MADRRTNVKLNKIPPPPLASTAASIECGRTCDLQTSPKASECESPEEHKKG